MQIPRPNKRELLPRLLQAGVVGGDTFVLAKTLHEWHQTVRSVCLPHPRTSGSQVAGSAPSWGASVSAWQHSLPPRWGQAARGPSVPT